MISLAGHLRLGKLILLWDDNRITDDGSTGLSISEDVAARFRVADWHVVEVDGHDLEAVSAAIGARQGRPAAVADRVPHGHRQAASRACRASAAATARKLFPEDAAAAREQLGWPYAAVRGSGRRAGRLARRRPPQRRRARALAGTRGCAARRPSAPSSNASSPASCPKAGATCCSTTSAARSTREPLASGIFISAEINDLLVDCMPERMVGCADLEAPTNHKRRLSAFTARGPQRRLRALRRARARDGRDGQRHGGARRRGAAGASPTSRSPTTSARRCAWPR